MNAQIKYPVKDFFDKPVVQQKFKELLGKNASSFATSVLQIVNSNSMLMNADPQTIFSAACMAATLNLPINNGLGFAYIVPFKNNKLNRTEAQFQLGWKGYVQLAQRSGQFERIAATAVYEGQLIENDPLLGFKFDWKVEKIGEPIGYVAFFKLLNGFTAELYMCNADIKQHAQRYSQTYKKGFGVWKDNFEAMALKTVLKLLLAKQAPLSIEMQTAQLVDQSIVRDIDNQVFDHIDNDALQIESSDQKIIVPDEEFHTLIAQLKAGALDKEYVFEEYNLTEQQQIQVSAL